MSTPKFTRFRQRLEAIRAALVSPFGSGSTTRPLTVRLRLEAMDERLAPSSLQPDAAFPDPTAPVVAESNSQPLADSSTNGNSTDETETTNAEPLLLPVTDPDTNSEPADPTPFDTQVPGNPADTPDPWDQWWLSVDPDAEAVILFDALAFAPNEPDVGQSAPTGSTDLASDDPEGYGPASPVETEGGADGSAPANEPKADQPKSDPKPFGAPALKDGKPVVYVSNREFRIPFDPKKGEAGGYLAISTSGDILDKATNKSLNTTGAGFVVLGAHGPNADLIKTFKFVQFESARVEVSDPNLANGAWANFQFGTPEANVFVHPVSKWDLSITGRLSMDTKEKGKGEITVPGHVPIFSKQEVGGAMLFVDAPTSAKILHDEVVKRQPKGFQGVSFRVTTTYYGIVKSNDQAVGYFQYTAQFTTGDKKITYGNAKIGEKLFSKDIIGEMTTQVQTLYPNQKELKLDSLKPIGQ